MKLIFSALTLLILVFALAVPSQAQDTPDVTEKIAYAESAGIPEIAADATILDSNGDVLRDGSNGWTCMYVPDAPMCLDEQWMTLLGAMMSGSQDVEVGAVGLSYMLEGDAGASNSDPFATGPTADNDWVVTGPHIMLISPDSATLEGIPTEPTSGGPYVMWAGTPFAHVMIPLKADSVTMPGSD